MSTLRSFVVTLVLTVTAAEPNTIFFTQSTYELWCQENVLSPSLLLYPHRTPIGIHGAANIQRVSYDLTDNEHYGLFAVGTKRIADFYFLIVNITRPLEINREYQDTYRLRVRARVITDQRSYVEHARVDLHVADSNDNDAVFDLDIYSKRFLEPLHAPHALLQLRASDADEIQHAQILYELSPGASSQPLSLHPLTGELYLLSTTHLQSRYELEIYAYDRHRRHAMSNDLKTKTRVQLHFPEGESRHRLKTITNETIEFEHFVSSYQIVFTSPRSWHLANAHQSILTWDVSPSMDALEVFILSNSSANAADLFMDRNEVYLNTIPSQPFDLHLLFCFFHRAECQYAHHHLAPTINLHAVAFSFASTEPILLEEDSPIHAYVTRVHVQHDAVLSDQQLHIDYKLLTHQDQFYVDRKTGILRLATPLKNQTFLLEVHAEIRSFHEFSSAKATIEIRTQAVNRHPPRFSSDTPSELFQLPYRFRAVDLDGDKESNGRISYRLSNCFADCPFHIDPNSGVLDASDMGSDDYFIVQKSYEVQVIAFDWGQPRSLESKMNVRIHPAGFLHEQDTGAIWDRRKIRSTRVTANQSISSIMSETIYLNIGFKQRSVSYYLNEDTPIATVIDHLRIESISFPLFVDHEKESLFFYVLNDTAAPFTVDSHDRALRVVHPLDRERQAQYHFQVILRLKATYAKKLHEMYSAQRQNGPVHFQYSDTFFQKMTIHIYISDVNDNDPSCLALHSQVYLKENQIHPHLFQARASDPDLGENGTIVYSLLGQHEYFAINSSTGYISCIQAIDRERLPFVHVHVLASDQGQPIHRQSLCVTMHVTIVDANDNVPQFPSGGYFFDVPSDFPRGTIIGQVNAWDADSSAELIYSLGTHSSVQIDNRTGHLQLKADLRRFAGQELNLTVRVSDGVHMNQTSIIIRVTSFVAAQEPVLIPEPAYSIVINQSTSVGTVVTNVYQHAQLTSASMDFVEIVQEERSTPFTIDREGSIRLLHPLTDATNSSYWLTIRFTRYRAHPPHAFLHVHIAIQEENFHVPQCQETYQHLKLYEHSIQYPFASIQAVTPYDHVHLQYSLVHDETLEKIFAVDRQTGFLQLTRTHLNDRQSMSDHLLTVRAVDTEHRLAVDCYLNIQLIPRVQLTPKFRHTSTYDIDLVDEAAAPARIKQRLFQVVALLDDAVYEKNLEVRYRIMDANQYFVINRQTGYVAAKRPLHAPTTYEFKVEAFTVMQDDGVELSENVLDSTADRGKGRIVSSRTILPVKIHVRSSSASTRPPHHGDSTLHMFVLLSLTVKVGSTILQLGMNSSQPHWFIMVSAIEYTRYFHVDFQTGELLLIRPLTEWVNSSTSMELQINTTRDWLSMQTIRVIVQIRESPPRWVRFAQSNYYSSVSKNLPVGIEIARVTVDSPADNCTYHIHSTQRAKSPDLFRVHPHSGVITIAQSLENSLTETHVLSIVYRCRDDAQRAFTRLHVGVLDRDRLSPRTNDAYRFGRDQYVVILDTSLGHTPRKDLVNFELISMQNNGKRMKPTAQIIEGDPFGLFSIDAINQSLVLLDESQARSYTYPIHLTIVDTSQKQSVNCTVTVFIANIGIQFTCPPTRSHAPYLPTYHSTPANSVDLFSGRQYHPYQSLVVRGFDPFTPWETAECFLQPDLNPPRPQLDFQFEQAIYDGYINGTLLVYKHDEPLRISIKDRDNYTNPLDITYELLDRSDRVPFHVDRHTGFIRYILDDQPLVSYTFLILAKYQSALAFARLNVFVQSHPQRTYAWTLFKPFVDNHTIGYLTEINSYLKMTDPRMSLLFSVDIDGRASVKNATLVSLGGDRFDFIIGTARVQINVVSKRTLQCSLNRWISSTEGDLIGFVNVLYDKSVRSFHLLNYNDLFVLDREYGLLRYRNPDQIIEDDLTLLIEMEHSRCLLAFNRSTGQTPSIIRQDRGREIERVGDIKKSYGEVKLFNAALVNHDMDTTRAPVFSQKSYTFALHLPRHANQSLFVGQVLARPYHRKQSRLLFHFLPLPAQFHIHPDDGIIYYIPFRFDNQTKHQLQVVARDLIYQRNTTVNVTVHVRHPEVISWSSSVFHRTVSETLVPGSIVFQPPSFATPNLQYSLFNHDPTLFEINAHTGQVTILQYLSKPSYSFHIRLSPLNHSLLVKLTVLDYNSHPPIFLNLPLNLTISSTDTFVTKLFAHDSDLADNAKLRYYLLDPEQQTLFAIDEKTGVITLKTSISQTLIYVNVGVTDGWHLTTKSLPISIYHYAKSAPKFTSDEYVFAYDAVLGRVHASDPDPNDQIVYRLYLEPDGIRIDPISGLITSERTLLSPTIEFFASASDLAQQTVYTKVKLFVPTQPRFTSHLYYIHLTPSTRVPSEIFHFQLVDMFGQLLTATRFAIDHPTSLLEFDRSKLILKEQLHPSKIYHFDINGYWRNYSCQTTVQIIFLPKNTQLNKKSYDMQLESHQLKENHLIEQLPVGDFAMQIRPTPLTMNNCTENVALRQSNLYFLGRPILSNVCFFEIHSTHNRTVWASQVKVTFVPSDMPPKFSSSAYYFYNHNVRVFAKGSNPIRYQLQANPYGLLIDSTTGIVSFKHSANRFDNLDRIQLVVHAIDEKTALNDTAVLHLLFHHRKDFQLPRDIPQCSTASIAISEQSLAGSVIPNLRLKSNSTSQYYILSGDKHGMFSINAVGQLYLVSSFLNRTDKDYFDLLLLSSASSLFYCRVNISIARTPRWPSFICPAMSIEWTIAEESARGTAVGNVKEILHMLNNDSALVDLTTMVLHRSNDSQWFHLNSTTGLLTVNARLDFEEKTSYTLTVVLHPYEARCTISITVQLINIDDNPVAFNRSSLLYTVDENNPVPFFVGRIQLIDLDRSSFFQYTYSLRAPSTQLAIDAFTGSIVLLAPLDRETHGETLYYDIAARNDRTLKTLTDRLLIRVRDVNDHGPLFQHDSHEIHVNKSSRPGTVVFQISATSKDPVANGRLTYRLVNSSSHFSINEQTGEIRLDHFLSSTTTNETLLVEAREEGINLTAHSTVFVFVVNDDYVYYQLENVHRCFLDENRSIGSEICAVGRASNEFRYGLLAATDGFDILANNGTIVSKRAFDYEQDQRDYNLTVVVVDRTNQSISLASLNLTVHIRNLNDNPPEFLTENSTTLFYPFFPSVDTLLYRIEATDRDQSSLSFTLLSNPRSSYLLRPSFNTTELILAQSVTQAHEDDLIVRVSDNQLLFSELHLRIVYDGRPMEPVSIISRTIDGYVNPRGNALSLKIGQLLVHNDSHYEHLYFDLLPNKFFFLRRLSNSETELHLNTSAYSASTSLQVSLSVFALSAPAPKFPLDNRTKIFLPPTVTPQIIHVHLWPISTEMLNRTVSLVLKLDANDTYEHFLIHRLPFVRQELAEMLSVQLHQVHVYAFDLQQDQIELLVAVSRSTTARYIHRAIVYNMLKNFTHRFERILLNQCQNNPCENNALCTSHMTLLPERYQYVHFDATQRLVPKYEKTVNCLCANSNYGQFCQFKQNKQSPCSSNPCSPMERCVEQSATLYTCQCTGELCAYDYDALENSLECINANSPTCRDPTNILTFDGVGFVRMNVTMSQRRHTDVKLSFRTNAQQGKLLRLAFVDAEPHTATIQLIDGYVHFSLDEAALLQIDSIGVHDGQWHDLHFAIDYAHNFVYYLLRLDHVFAKRISLLSHTTAINVTQLTVGSSFDGCLGNLSFNHQLVPLHSDPQESSIELIGTKSGCQSMERVQEYPDDDEICAMYHPCYHGAGCANHGLSFTCNCSNARFSGRQCQLDRRPCESLPCRFDEQCLSFASHPNRSYTCIPTLVSLSTVIQRSIYLGLVIMGILCVILIAVVFYCRKSRRKLGGKKLSVSSPLLVRKSTLDIGQADSPMHTLVKLDGDRKQSMKTMTLVDSVPIQRKFPNRFAQRPKDFGQQKDAQYYSSIEPGHAPLNNLHDHYTSIDEDDVNHAQAIDLFDLSSSPTQYFNVHSSDSQINYRIRMNTLSDLTANIIEQPDVELTDSSNTSSDYDQALQRPLISIRTHKRSLAFRHPHAPASSKSLSDVPVYAHIVRTSQLALHERSNPEHFRPNNSLPSTPSLFIKPIDQNAADRRKPASKSRTNVRFKHASDSDLYSDDKSDESSSFFQTDV